jgi:hypothetical protein
MSVNIVGSMTDGRITNIVNKLYGLALDVLVVTLPQQSSNP